MADSDTDNTSEFEALCRLIRRGQEEFFFVLVRYDLPQRRRELLDKLAAALPEVNLVTVTLAPPAPDVSSTYNVLDQLRDRAHAASPDRAPDVLVILGYETLLLEDPERPDSPPAPELGRAIQPLNLGRNLLKEAFPCPVLLCLPQNAMAVFLNNAPDLATWRSGYYRFNSDLEQVRAELVQAAQQGTGWWARWRLWRRSPEDLHAEAQRLEGLLADARAMAADPELLARLYQRLGWVAVALGNRTQARSAFAEMLHLARVRGDHHLVRAAKQGQGAADRLRSAPQVQAFRGAAALTGGESLLGREEELGRLVGLVAPVGSRFLSVWGEMGCGKTSLVRAGLIPRLKELSSKEGGYLPILVTRWDDPEAGLRRALEQATSLDLAAQPTVLTQVARVARETSKTVVVLCDQFEHFFAAHPRRSDRQPFEQAIGACVRDLSVPCKLVLVIRQDQLGQLAEFDDYVPEVLEQRKRFYVPLFNEVEAQRVLRQLAPPEVQWSDAFIRAVVADLTHDGRIRPIELRLVGSALALKGIDNDLDYARAGMAQGLLADYVDLVLDSLYQPQMLVMASFLQVLRWGGLTAELSTLLVRILLQVFRLLSRVSIFHLYDRLFVKLEHWLWVRSAKHLLLTLVADPEGRLTLSFQELVRRTSGDPESTRWIVERLVTAHLVRRVEGSPSANPVAGSEGRPLPPPATERYELTHDYLAGLVLLATRDLQDWRRQAHRILRRALEDSTVRPSYTIGVRDWFLIRQHADEQQLAQPQVQALLRRSALWAVFKWLVLTPALTVLVLAVLQCSTGHLTIERDYRDRIVIRRGLPWLSFLPVLGDDVILDTGFTYFSLDRAKGTQVQGLVQIEWGERQSGVLRRPQFVGALSAKYQGVLLCQIGQEEQGLSLLSEAMNSPHVPDQGFGVVNLEEVARVEPTRAAEVFSLLAKVVANPGHDPVSRRRAVQALSAVARADPKLAPQVVRILVPLLADQDDELAFSAVQGLESTLPLARAQADEVLQFLQKRLNGQGMDPGTRRLAARALGAVAQVDPALANAVFDPLIQLLKEKRSWVQEAAVKALGQVRKAGPALADKVDEALLPLLKNKNEFLIVRWAALEVLWPVVRTDSALAGQVLDSLLPALTVKGRSSLERRTAAKALGRMVQDDRALATKAREPLRQLLEIKEDSSKVRPSAAWALGKLAQAEPTRAGELLPPLLALLQDESATREERREAADALGRVLHADRSGSGRVYDAVLPMLNERDIEVHNAAARTLVWVARVNGAARQQAFELLTNYRTDYDVILDPLAEVLVVWAEEEAKFGGDAVPLLLDHLAGRRTLLPNGNANTHAVYRDTVAQALARWLAEVRPGSDKLRAALEHLRKEGPTYLRIAAWQSFATEARLRDLQGLDVD
jgi:hypothetical protein